MEVEGTWLEQSTTVSHYLLSVIIRRDAVVWEDKPENGKEEITFKVERKTP
jgi:hypothetical protein